MKFGFRDEGILTTGYLIANTTMLKVWKGLWREQGLGAFTLFQTEFGYQVCSFMFNEFH